MKQVAVRQTAQYGAFGAKAKKRVCLFLANTLIALYSLWVDLGEKLEPVTAKLRVIGKKTKKRVCLFLANTLIALYSLWVDVQEGVCAAAAKLRVVGKKTKKRVCLLLANTLIALYSLWVDVQEGVCAAAAKLRVIGKKAKKGVCLFLANTLIRLYSLWVDTEEWVLSLRAKPKRRSPAQAAAMLVLAVGVLFGAFVTQGTEETVSWLSPVQAVIPGNEFTGKVISAYFHSGNGTKSSPYVITRPEHYYHMVQLIQRGVLKGSEYYQLGLKGLDPAASTSYRVYSYSDSGKQQFATDGVTPKYTSTLNMKYYTAGNGLTIVPIGGKDGSFTGSFNGNGLTISNLTIQTSQTYTYQGESVKKTYANAGVFAKIGSGATVQKFRLAGATIIVSQKNSVAGVIAGVNNGTLSRVSVSSGTIKTEKTATATSAYTLVGQTSKNAVTMQVTTTTSAEPVTENSKLYTNENDSGSENNTSINLNQIFTRLKSVESSLSSDTTNMRSGTFEVFPNKEYITQTVNNGVVTKETSKIYEDAWIGNADTSNGGTTFTYDPIENRQIKSFSRIDFNETNITSGTDSWNVYSQADLAGSTAGSYAFSAASAVTKAVSALNYANSYDGTNGFLQFIKNISQAIQESSSIVDYIFLHGIDPAAYKRTVVTNQVDESNQVNYFYITDGKGNYLNLKDDNSAFVNGTSQSTATKWTMRGSYLYGMGQNGAYYLNLAPQGGGAYNIASPSLSGSTKWSYDSSSGSITFKPDSSKTYYIKYKDGVWYVAQNSATYTVAATVNGTKYYLNASGTTILTETTPTTSWYFENGSSGRFYCVQGGQKYYLDSSVNLTDIGNSISLKTNDGNTWTKTSDNRVSRTHTIGSGIFKTTITVFLNIYYGSSGLYTKNAWCAYQNNGSDLAMGYLETVYDTSGIATAVSGGTTPLVTTSVQTDVDKYPGETYVPINVKGDSSGTFTYSADNTTNLEATNTNMGYIISGGRKHGQFYSRDSGTVRFAQIDADTIFNRTEKESYTNGSVTKVYTIDADSNQEGGAGKVTVDPSKFQHYTEAKENFETALANANGRACGVHFVYDSYSISTDFAVTAKKVQIAGTEYTNYTMPRNCIDFKVMNTGTINCFASTFYVNAEDIKTTDWISAIGGGGTNALKSYNTAFFSLHEITRSGNSITSIKEISKIYGVKDGANKEYVYEYTDGSFSGSTSGLTVLFDTTWLTNPRLAETNMDSFKNRLYYFEIPVNEGEYALGSIANEQGAYLMYLDLGANAQEIDRKTVTENSHTDVGDYNTLENVTVYGSVPSAGVIASYTGELKMANTAKSETAKVSYSKSKTGVETYTATNSAKVNYIAKECTFTDGTNTLTATPVSSTFTKLRDTTYYDKIVGGNTDGSDAYIRTNVQSAIVENKDAAGKVTGTQKTILINAWQSTSTEWTSATTSGGGTALYSGIQLVQAADGSYSLQSAPSGVALTYYAQSGNTAAHYRITCEGKQTLYIYPDALAVSDSITNGTTTVTHSRK